MKTESRHNTQSASLNNADLYAWGWNLNQQAGQGFKRHGFAARTTRGRFHARVLSRVIQGKKSQCLPTPDGVDLFRYSVLKHARHLDGSLVSYQATGAELDAVFQPQLITTSSWKSPESSGLSSLPAPKGWSDVAFLQYQTWFPSQLSQLEGALWTSIKDADKVVLIEQLYVEPTSHSTLPGEIFTQVVPSFFALLGTRVGTAEQGFWLNTRAVGQQVHIVNPCLDSGWRSSQCVVQIFTVYLLSSLHGKRDQGLVSRNCNRSASVLGDWTPCTSTLSIQGASVRVSCSTMAVFLPRPPSRHEALLAPESC